MYMDSKYSYAPESNKTNRQIIDSKMQQPPAYSDCNAPPVAPPAAAPASTIVTVNNVGGMPMEMSMTPIPVGRDSLIMTCPHCRCRNKTRTAYKVSTKTHIACLLLSCTGLCCLPYCMKTCRNVDHFCPICEAFLGSYVS